MPCTRPIERFGDVVVHPILGGLHHRYEQVGKLNRKLSPIIREDEVCAERPVAANWSSARYT
jgi:hypothetical protein